MKDNMEHLPKSEYKEYLSKAEYKGFEYNHHYDEIDNEIRVWFHYNSDPCRTYCWKYFETESNFKTFIDELIKENYD